MYTQSNITVKKGLNYIVFEYIPTKSNVTIDIKSKSADKRKVLQTNFKYLEKEQKIHIYFLMIGVHSYEIISTTERKCIFGFTIPRFFCHNSFDNRLGKFVHK